LNERAFETQLAIMFFIAIDRGIEDVEGMSGHHMASSVAATSRVSFRFLGQALAAFHGAVRVSDEGMLAWSAESGAALDVVRGLFPDADHVDDQLEWLRTAARHVASTMCTNAAVRVIVPPLARWFPANIQKSVSRQVPDAVYRAPRPPTTAGEVDVLLREYGTSIDEILARLPLSDDAAVRLAGSIAEGHGHPRSDIDLIVLVRDLPQASFSAVDLFAGHREMTPGATRTGNLIGVEYLTDRALADLRRRQDEYERALELLASDGRSRAARVQAWQWLRSLHGWAGGEKYVSMALMTPVLRDGSTAAHWTRALSLETWCSAMIVSHLLEHERLWLRAQMHRAGHPTVAAAFGRGAWEQLFQAYLVSRGTVRWKPRWILDAVRQLDDPPLFACARRAIFPRPDEAEPYLRWTEREAPSLIGRIAEQAPDALRPLMDQLAPCSAPAYD
jgi:predicted nucleotidyltransferase